MTNQNIIKFFNSYGITASVGFLVLLVLIMVSGHYAVLSTKASKATCTIDGLVTGTQVQTSDGLYRVTSFVHYRGIGEYDIELSRQ